MAQRRSISGIEFRRTLELMGLTIQSRYGSSCVLIDSRTGEHVVIMESEEWDMAPEDVVRVLDAHGLDVSRFWECNQSLYL